MSTAWSDYPLVLKIRAGVDAVLMLGWFYVAIMLPHEEQALTGVLTELIYLVDLLIALIAAPLVIYAGTVFHELGHLLLAFAVSFRWTLLRVGPFSLDRRGGRIRFTFDAGLVNWQRGGEYDAVPPDGQSLRVRYSLLALGGPLVQGMIGFLALAMLVRWHTAVPTWADYVWGLFAYNALSSAFFNLVPFVGAYGPSDGQTIARLAQNTPQSDYHAARLAIDAYHRAVIPPTAWPLDIVQSMLLLRDGSAEDVSGLMIGAAYARALGNPALEQKLIDRAARTSTVPDYDVCQEYATYRAGLDGLIPPEQVLTDMWYAPLVKQAGPLPDQ